MCLMLCLGAGVAGRMQASNLFSLLSYGGENDITAVASRKAPSYIRIQLANGSYIPESYVFGEGGVWSGEKVDFSIDKLKFLDVAHMIAGPLKTQNYVPGKDPFTTKLLIMVYWGTSHGQEHLTESAPFDSLKDAQSALNRAQVELGGAAGSYLGKGFRGNFAARQTLEELQGQVDTAAAMVKAQDAMRDQADELNVMMLGYDSWWDSSQRYVGTPMAFRRQDLLDEIEEDRYFVVLMAYDLQTLRVKKRARLLWETRFSIRERHHAFNEDLPAMALYASQYFGQDSHGLVHKAVPLGHVDIGNMESLGDVPKPDNVKLPPPANP